MCGGKFDVFGFALMGYVESNPLKYKEAEELLNAIEIEKLCTQKEYNIFVTRKADLLRRKAEFLDEVSQKEQRKDMLLEAFSSLAKEGNPDDSMNSMLCKIAADIVFIPNFKECADAILTVIFERVTSLLTLIAYREFKYKLRKSLNVIGESLAAKCLELLYGIDVTNYGENVGQVLVVKDNYGFITNAKYPSGIYFANFGDFRKGDKVSFKVIKKYDKLRAVGLKLIQD